MGLHQSIDESVFTLAMKYRGKFPAKEGELYWGDHLGGSIPA